MVFYAQSGRERQREKNKNKNKKNKNKMKKNKKNNKKKKSYMSRNGVKPQFVCILYHLGASVIAARPLKQGHGIYILTT